MAEPEIRDPEDFPALYQSVNQESLAAQQAFLTWFKIRVGGLLVAALGGAIGWSNGDFRIGGVIAFLAFACALGAELILAIQRPDRVWYEGRAAAESAKTLTWRYMVQGESFEREADKPEALLLSKLTEILQDLTALTPRAATGEQQQVTPRMREIRALSFAHRQAIYLHKRIEDQQGWYARKSAWNETRAKRWVWASVGFEIAGLLGGAMKAFGAIDIDLLGVFAAAAATITAWIQAKQYQNLATAYGVTSQELSSVATEVSMLTDEKNWPHFVGKAEDAISREHTLWRVSRGLQIVNRSQRR